MLYKNTLFVLISGVKIAITQYLGAMTYAIKAKAIAHVEISSLSFFA